MIRSIVAESDALANFPPKFSFIVLSTLAAVVKSGLFKLNLIDLFL